MTNTLSVDRAITKLADSYKIWTIGTGRTQQVLPQQTFRDGSDRNYNLKAGSLRTPGVLIHFDRTVGGDIGRPDSQTWWDQAKDKLAGLTREAVTKLVIDKLNGR